MPLKSGKMNPGFLTASLSILLLHRGHCGWNNVTRTFCLESSCQSRSCPAVDGELVKASSSRHPSAVCGEFGVQTGVFCEENDYGQNRCRECRGVCKHPAAKICETEGTFCRRAISEDSDLFCVSQCGEPGENQCRTLFGLKDCSETDYVNSVAEVFTDSGKVCAGPCRDEECSYVEWIEDGAWGWKLHKKTGSCVAGAGGAGAGTGDGGSSTPWHVVGPVIGVVVVVVLAVLGFFGFKYMRSESHEALPQD